MYSVRDQLAAELDEIRDAGLFKAERVIGSPQQANVRVGDGEVLNLCANNYLGLADHPALIEAAQAGARPLGLRDGVACASSAARRRSTRSSRRRSRRFLGTEDTILYGSCFDANGGLFETLLGPEDAVISDALNHASIIDGIRLCKAQRHRYANSDMDELEALLKETAGARRRLIATDGVFSMDGYVAKLDEICDLAERYDAMVMVDDSHAVGFVGEGGRGTPELNGVMDRVDIITGTLGKALGGASGGYTSGRAEIVELLRQRSRPYLFSNTLAPPIVAASLKVLELLESGGELRARLRENTARFRARMTELGFDVLPGDHPIAPIMYGDAVLAGQTADAMLERGIYVIAFSFPVVPRGQARIRTQMSAAHSTEDIDRAIAAFEDVRTAVPVP